MLRRAASLRSGVVGACTESLGSESGDVGGDAEIDHQLRQQDAAAEDEEQEARTEAEPQQAVASPEEKRPRLLPPPMPRAAEGAFFSMRAERRGGRLILTEVVRVDQRRREVFRASRDGGRLRLQFADDSTGSNSPGSEPAAAGAKVVGGCCNDAGEFRRQVAASRLVR